MKFVKFKSKNIAEILKVILKRNNKNIYVFLYLKKVRINCNKVFC